MKALLCRRFGPPEALTVEDVPSPSPKAGEVRVRVKAAGVNFPDALSAKCRGRWWLCLEGGFVFTAEDAEDAEEEAVIPSRRRGISAHRAAEIPGRFASSG